MRRRFTGSMLAVLAVLVFAGCEASEEVTDAMGEDPGGEAHDLDALSQDIDGDLHWPDADDDADDDDADDDAGDDGEDRDSDGPDDADAEVDVDADDSGDDLDASGDDGTDASDLDADDDTDDGEDGPREWDVETSGFSFVPATVTLKAGDWVRFTLGATHDVVEVEEATWNANGNAPKAGGFVVGLGQTADVSFPVAGTYWYVCAPHADLGMKGKIIVLP